MASAQYHSALIVGAGDGLSASLARLFAREGMGVVLAARNVEKLAGLASETGARALACDASDPVQVARLFAELDETGAPDVVVYNASARARGPFVDLVPAEVERALAVSAFGGFLVAQQAARDAEIRTSPPTAAAPLPTSRRCEAAAGYRGRFARSRRDRASSPAGRRVRCARRCGCRRR